MAEEKRPPANGFVRVVRRVYHPLHFYRGYNFVLFFIMAGALFGFSLARFMYLNIDGVFCNPTRLGTNGAAPGECYFYSGDAGQRWRIGIILHLGAILPCGLLVVLQFVPVIRHKLLLLHRVNGYVILLLSLVSSAGVLMILEKTFGGSLAMQAAGGLVTLMFLTSLGIAYYNIKRLQIEQHRAWMLRAWFYGGIIITLRIIMITSAYILSAKGNFFEAKRCEDVDYIFAHFQNWTELLYPECKEWYSGANPNQYTVVYANIKGDPAQAAAALSQSFTMAAWMSLAIHAIGVEIYLHLTPREAERLRNVSYQRQVEAGMRNPGNAGLTVQRLGDANAWTPEAQGLGSQK